MTTLRFLNGTTTIGGNIVEFVQGDSRVLMDFGMVAPMGTKTVSEAMADHTLPHLPDLLLPDQPALFRHQAIFISHLHLDHMGALRYLQNHEIPIYLSPDALKLYQILIAQGVEPPIANLHPLTLGQPLTIGSLKVTGMLSDHDTIGALALLVEDGQHRFVHSGDVRLNGPHPERVAAWSDQVKNNLDVYLSEATTYSFTSEQPQMIQDSHHEHPYSEGDLPAALREQARDTAGLLVVNPYPRNVERLIAFNQAARQSHRPILWEPEFAQIIGAFAPDEPLNVISAAPLAQANTTVYSWAEAQRRLAADPRDFILHNSWAHLQRLTDFTGGTYLHSNGEPLGDYDPRFATLQTFLAEHHYQIVPFGASGHARREDLLTLAEKINARRTVPWHSFKPERMADLLYQTRTEPWLPETDIYYRFD
ncbi:MBL fold metallo-hydrolase [Lapidilactobacillus achengensis]|uniref:MBL fold metallo-hydrolase n=1 Tax=Lapidilactobacillus achengensis TaxID=2486000 RepID=A0ABW1UPM4_9LACO|nr:MBL fold metallo-hydrolase [Lapidilactobacillus achengensis]